VRWSRMISLSSFVRFFTDFLFAPHFNISCGCFVQTLCCCLFVNLLYRIHLQEGGTTILTIELISLFLSIALCCCSLVQIIETHNEGTPMNFFESFCMDIPPYLAVSLIHYSNRVTGQHHPIFNWKTIVLLKFSQSSGICLFRLHNDYAFHDWLRRHHRYAHEPTSCTYIYL
jgi:hypothetical protein